MGGSRPSAPVTYMPTPAAPTLFKSVIPEADFGRANDYLTRLMTARQAAQQESYKQVGTPAEIGARSAGVRAQEAASYAASLPTGKEYDVARGVANTALNEARYDQLIKQSYGAPEKEATGTVTWGYGTPGELAAQEMRDKEGRINRMILAKDLAKKAQDAGVSDA